MGVSTVAYSLIRLFVKVNGQRSVTRAIGGRRLLEEARRQIFLIRK